MRAGAFAGAACMCMCVYAHSEWCVADTCMSRTPLPHTHHFTSGVNPYVEDGPVGTYTIHVTPHGTQGLQNEIALCPVGETCLGRMNAVMIMRFYTSGRLGWNMHGGCVWIDACLHRSIHDVASTCAYIHTCMHPIPTHPNTTQHTTTQQPDPALPPANSAVDPPGARNPRLCKSS